MRIVDRSLEVLKKEGFFSLIERTVHYLFYKLKRTKHLPQSKKSRIIYSSRTSRQKKSIFIFSGIPYYDIGGGQRGSQLAKTFYKMGYIVHYFYAYEAADGSDKKNIHMPVETHMHVDNFTEKEIIDRLTEDSIFIFEVPLVPFEKYLDLASRFHIPTVYEHIDNWETSLGSSFFNMDVFRRFISKADLLVATSKLLKEKLQKLIRDSGEIQDKEIVYLANAVDSDLFEYMIKREKPKDLVNGKKTLIYYGSLWGEWFDWDLLKHVAERYPDYAINLIGDYESIKAITKTLPQNIHFLGLKKQGELPAYLQYSDITLLPFKNDEIGKYVSPLKIFEYVCMGKIVVSTALPDIQGYPNVYCSDEKEGWAELLSKDYELQEFNAFIIENNWYSRCRCILDNVKRIKEKQSISVIVLNRNNKSVIKRCVDSLLNNNSHGYEVIVVDNQSTDGSCEMLQENYNEKISLLKNSKNGCSSGRNLGVKYAKGNIIVFLDSDQWVLDKGWLDNAMDILSTRKEIGAVGWAAGWFNKNSVVGPIADYYPNRAMRLGELYRKDIAYLGTGGLVLRKEVFNIVEGFDEYYDPTCFEDTDLSLKIRNAGYELAYCPFIGVFHLPHQTTESGSAGHKDLMKKNGDYFLNKWKKKNACLLQYYYNEF